MELLGQRLIPFSGKTGLGINGLLCDKNNRNVIVQKRRIFSEHTGKVQYPTKSMEK